jgi:hypothetical protein
MKKRSLKPGGEQAAVTSLRRQYPGLPLTPSSALRRQAYQRPLPNECFAPTRQQNPRGSSLVLVAGERPYLLDWINYLADEACAGQLKPNQFHALRSAG